MLERGTGSWSARWLGLGVAVGFLILSIAVRLGRLDAWDATTRSWFRPNDEWGPLQLRADYVVEGLRPVRIVPLLAIIVLIVCAVRRSLRPAVFAGVSILLLAALTTVTQVLVSRPDPHGAVHRLGGSFPSGHTATVIVCSAVLVLVLWPRPAAVLWLLPVLAGSLMGASLLVQAAHWTSDVIGGALLAGLVLAAVGGAGLARVPGDGLERGAVSLFPPSRASGERSDRG